MGQGIHFNEDTRSHSDTPHPGARHSDTPHSNTPHSDAPHSDTPHSDKPHSVGLLWTSNRLEILYFIIWASLLNKRRLVVCILKVLELHVKINFLPHRNAMLCHYKPTGFARCNNSIVGAHRRRMWNGGTANFIPSLGIRQL